MHRIPEPELMDDPVQAQAYARADFAEPNTLFLETFGACFGEPSFGGYIVDLGCGPADIAVRLARAYRHCYVHGVDGSESMLRFATEHIANASLSERIELFQCTLPGITLPRSCYDAVVSNSLLHHLADPYALWSVTKRLAVPGAPILVMDLVRPTSRTEVRRLVSLYAADAPAVLRRDFERSLLAAYSSVEVREQLAQAQLDYLDVRIISDRHFVVIGRFHG